MLTGRASSTEFLILSPYVQSPETPFLEDETLWVGGGISGSGLVGVVRESLKRAIKQLPSWPPSFQAECAVRGVL